MFIVEFFIILCNLISSIKHKPKIIDNVFYVYIIGKYGGKFGGEYIPEQRKINKNILMSIWFGTDIVAFLFLFIFFIFNNYVNLKTLIPYFILITVGEKIFIFSMFFSLRITFILLKFIYMRKYKKP